MLWIIDKFQSQYEKTVILSEMETWTVQSLTALNVVKLDLQRKHRQSWFMHE